MLAVSGLSVAPVRRPSMTTTLIRSTACRRLSLRRLCRNQVSSRSRFSSLDRMLTHLGECP
eukprot:4893796-Lingulodinium_polyedra.AAC.1